MNQTDSGKPTEPTEQMAAAPAETAPSAASTPAATSTVVSSPPNVVSSPPRQAESNHSQPASLRPLNEPSEEEKYELLFSRLNYEKTIRTGSGHFKLKNMIDIMQWLGNPHLAYPVVHVAGTKGKGSVATMIGAILSASGVKTGVYTSPHLESVRQRIAIDAELISEQNLLGVLDQMREMISALDDQARLGERRPVTFFELITTAAFLHFANEPVDAAVFEVGLGGRLDSTNICQPEVTVITNISLDHTRQLGETVEEIAVEKAGIIKRGIPVISGAINPSAAAVIERIAAENEAPLYVLDRDFFFEVPDPPNSHESETRRLPESVSGSQMFSTFGSVNGSDYRIDNLRAGIPGQHQIANASLAVAAAQILRAKFPAVTDRPVRHGLAAVSPAGRTEIISHSPGVILDMAHNVASISALMDAVQQLSGWQSATARRLVIAISRDKDATGMLRLLTGHFDEIVFTKYQTNPRGVAPEELLELATRLRDQMNLATLISVIDDPVRAWTHVRSVSSDNDFICITGSAFLVAELRPLLTSTPA